MRRFGFERWYRDAWLLVITGLVAWALWAFDREVANRQEAVTENRVDVARESCESQNERHDETIGKLDEQIAKLPPARRREAEARRDGTIALIEALAPKRNCKALIREIRSVDG